MHIKDILFFLISLLTMAQGVRVTDGYSPGIQYVSPTGNDSNDGLYWNTAKATIYSALEALPGGSVLGSAAGGGVVYVADGSRANPVPGAGIWLMGPSDPNHGHLPRGWLRFGNHTALKIQGVNCQHAVSNSTNPVCMVGAGSAADNKHPAIWISSTSQVVRMENLGFQYPATGMKLGINSNGARSGANQGATNQSFENVSIQLSQTPGSGPGVDIGDNSFNIWFRKSSLSGNGSATLLIARLFCASNVVTATTTTNHGYSSGENVGISDATLGRSPFNGSFRNITVTGPTTFTFHLTCMDGTTGGGGFVVNDRAFALRIDPTAKGTGSGLIWFQDVVINGSGIRDWLAATTGSSVYVSNVYTESDFVRPTSPLLWVGGSQRSGNHFEVNHSSVVDQPAPYSSVLLENDTPTVADNFLVFGGGDGQIVRGAATIVGNPISGGAQPFKAGQQGIIGNHLWAQTDVARASPQTVRYRNISVTDNRKWSCPGVVSNVADRDGGTNAATFSSSSGVNTCYFNYHTAVTIAAGDFFICGVWVRSNTANGYSGSPTQAGNCSVGDTTVTYAINTSYGAASSGDGEWEWMWTIFKIATTAGGGDLLFSVNADPTHTVTAYDPIIIRIPAGTVSDNEAFNIGSYLRGYSDKCTVGQVCDAIGPFLRDTR